MSHSLRKQWAHFAALPSGQRFQSRYRAQRAQAGGLLRKVLIVSAGVLIMLIGFGMLVLPGPGLLVLIVGAAFVAEESLLVARLLDRVDLWISRRVHAWQQRRSERKARRKSEQDRE